MPFGVWYIGMCVVQGKVTIPLGIIKEYNAPTNYLLIFLSRKKINSVKTNIVRMWLLASQCNIQDTCMQ